MAKNLDEQNVQLIPPEKIHSFETKLAEFRDGMFVSHNRNGDLHSRPMHILQRDEEENIWMACNYGNKLKVSPQKE
jgi:general stress protein 26